MISVVTPDAIINDTCRQFQLTRAELIGPLKWEWRVMARKHAAKRMREELGMNYREIGQRLGGRHRTTVMNLLGVLHVIPGQKRRVA